MSTPITVYGDVDARAVAQLRRCADAGDALRGALCADGHVGYSQPIGGAVAYPDHISPSGVGYDIACLPAGTPVTMADGYWLAIESVAAGARVIGWDIAALRVVHPCDGAIARGRRPLRSLVLADGREVRLTGDHRVRTRLGWTRADALKEGEAVACASFVGLPYEDAAGEIDVSLPPVSGRRRDPRILLRERGLWPLRADHARLPELLRLLAYCAGDGNLGVDGKTLSWYTSVAGDADDLVADLVRLGFQARRYDRVRRGLHVVVCRSVELHALFAALGCRVGKKVYAWPASPFQWLFALPAWLRGVFLSSFMSAEALAPRTGCVAALAVKQAGVTDAAIRFVERLFASLGFLVHATRSGRVSKDGRRCWVAQLQGGEPEIVRYLREIGFNRAWKKRVAAAAMLSAIAQRRTEIGLRDAAVAEAVWVHGAGGAVAAITADASARFGVPRSLVHHGLYERGSPRVPKGWKPDPDHSGEIAWLPVVANEDAGLRVEVYDVVTRDPAESFLAAGVVVHNCGNKAARTDVRADDVRRDLPRIMDEVFGRISFGVGRRNEEPVEHEVLEKIARAEFAPQRELRDLAAEQLGTVGAGNHYVDLFEDEQGWVWVGVHFGSRGFGHRTASGFLALAQGLAFGERARETAMDSAPVLLHTGSELGQSYISAMTLAGEYAYAGRDVVVARVLEILGANATHEVHNHHNFAWKERHFGTDVWVIRKGCTPAFPGQEGFVGATMGEPSVILRGADSEASRELMYSTVHGAGRVMSRTQAAGRRRRGRFTPGLIDFDAVRKELEAKRIELRGGAADEAPAAYKRLDRVLAAHGGTIDVVHRLKPLGVAMAPAHTFDPYKD